VQNKAASQEAAELCSKINPKTLAHFSSRKNTRRNTTFHHAFHHKFTIKTPRQNTRFPKNPSKNGLTGTREY
jgi:hypothetical protein